MYNLIVEINWTATVLDKQLLPIILQVINNTNRLSLLQGAREFVVPTREPGQFYSLVQSPQQFKQMLMVGGIDRYFQIARCYRDEATRKDRQPEFTQLDIELSFTDQDKIFDLVEQIIRRSWPASEVAMSADDIQLPFQRLKYDEVMEKYGSDKPDLRYDLSLRNVTKLVELNEGLATQYEDHFGAYAIVLREPHSGFPTAFKAAVSQQVKTAPVNSRLFVSKVKEATVMDWAETSGIVQPLSNVVTKALAADLELHTGDLLFLGVGKRAQAQTLMGRVRTMIMESLEERGLVPKRSASKELKFAWVLDFPMFTENEETGALESTHHPFTAPHPEDAHRLRAKQDLRTIRSLAYDLVLNGQEIGGGSMRIDDGDLQQFVLDEILRIPHVHLLHLIEALQSGCPPHGGIAVGIDRLLQIMCNANSIRDVIAFPKSLDAKDHLSKAPEELSDADLAVYHIKVASKAENKDVVLE